MKTFKLAVVAGALSFALSGCGGGSPKAELVNSRLEPWTNANGIPIKMVYVDWKNTGSAPVKQVNADVIIYDAAGNESAMSGRDYTIYVVADTDDGIAPGESYNEPIGEGFAALPDAARVEVRITQVKSEGMKF